MANEPFTVGQIIFLILGIIIGYDIKKYERRIKNGLADFVKNLKGRR